MTERLTKPSLRERIRWWLYERCFAYCVWCADSTADPDEFSLFDIENFVAISNDEVKELIDEAPEIAWHFASKRASND